MFFRRLPEDMHAEHGPLLPQPLQRQLLNPVSIASQFEALAATTPALRRRQRSPSRDEEGGDQRQQRVQPRGPFALFQDVYSYFTVSQSRQVRAAEEMGRLAAAADMQSRQPT